MARNYFSGMSGGWLAGLNGNITNSSPKWVWLGLGLGWAKNYKLSMFILDLLVFAVLLQNFSHSGPEFFKSL